LLEFYESEVDIVGRTLEFLEGDRKSYLIEDEKMIFSSSDHRMVWNRYVELKQDDIWQRQLRLDFADVFYHTVFDATGVA